KVDDGSRGQRVEGAAEIRHRGGQDGGDHQAGASVREMADNKSREDPVAHGGNRFFRMVEIKAVEHDPDNKEETELEEDYESAREQGSFAVALVPGCQKALHDQLVHAVAGRVEKGSADHAGPEGVRYV